MAPRRQPIVGSPLEKKSKVLKRTLTFVLKQYSDDNDNTARFTKAKINYRLSDINFNVAKRLAEISQIFEAPVQVSVSQSLPPVPVFVDTIEDVINVISDSEDLRVIVKFEDYDVESLKQIIQNKRISHIVEINVVDNIFGRIPTTDLNDENLSCATIYPKSVDGIYRVIEDVMLDIAMYHTIVAPFLTDDNEIRKSLSFLKVSYAHKEKLSSEHWNTNHQKGYVSLAGYFRTKTGFDCWGYIKCWNDILNEARQCNPDSFAEVSMPIEAQLEKHPLNKVLPVKKIVRMYSSLPKGNYLLITTTKRPSEIQTRKSVLQYFKGYKGRERLNKKINWTRTKVNIVPFDRIVMLQKHLNWINIFQIFK